MPRYFRLFLFAPFLLAVIGATVPVLRDIGLFEAAMAFMMGGFAPYVVFVFSACLWSLKQGDVDHAKAFVLSPFVFGIFCFVYGLFSAYMDFSRPTPLFVALGVAATFAVFGIVISAIYSWSALGIWWVICLVRVRFGTQATPEQ